MRAGLVHVVEGHRVFTQLTVFDNLLLAGYGMPRGERAARVEEALAFFPEIAAKRHDRAVTLSGGQQQMLAVAQGLVRRPRLLMLDEPSAGLSPVLVDRVLAAVARLREGGTAVLLVEQLIEKALAVADRVYALARGSIVLEATRRGRSAEPAGARLFRPGCQRAAEFVARSGGEIAHRVTGLAPASGAWPGLSGQGRSRTVLTKSIQPALSLAVSAWVRGPKAERWSAIGSLVLNRGSSGLRKRILRFCPSISNSTVSRRSRP